MILKPLGELAYGGNVKPILKELDSIKHSIEKSELYSHFVTGYVKSEQPQPIMMNALRVSCIAEKALIYLYSEDQLKYLAKEIGGDMEYINERLVENRKLQV